MNTNDPVRTFLSDRGCSPQVVEGGIELLIESWERTVDSVDEGYTLGLDDYLNDLDARQLIEDVIDLVPVEERSSLTERVRFADERMKEIVELQEICLWSDVVAEMEGWNSSDNWWYYARPRNADPQLLEEIDQAD